MVLFQVSVRTGMIAASALASVFGSTTAFANSSANADIAAPLRAAQAAKQTALGNGDEEFRRLFSSWQDADKPLVAVSRPDADASSASRPRTGSVSIPSIIPVDGVHLTSGFGMRNHPIFGGRRAHKGLDLAAPIGTPIRASADGTVSKAEWFSGYGLFVSLEHGGEIQTRYGHMSRLNVYNGQQVKKGDVIGYVGSTGNSTGPHLHYEVRIDGVAVNPTPYMQGTHLAAATNSGAMGGE